MREVPPLPKGRPRGGSRKYIFGKDRSTANPIQPSVTLSQPGDARAAGARAPESTLSPENPESNTHRESRTSDSKTSQNHRIPPSGCPCFPHMRPVEADPRCFSQKTGSFFPDQEPPLFFGHSAPPGIPEVPDNLLNLPFSAIKGRPLNCTVFFHLKWPVSKNTGLKRESWRGLAPLPLELPGHDSGLVPLRRRIDHGRE